MELFIYLQKLLLFNIQHAIALTAIKTKKLNANSAHSFFFISFFYDLQFQLDENKLIPYRDYNTKL